MVPARPSRLSPRERVFVPLAAWAFVTVAWVLPPGFLDARAALLLHLPYKVHAAEALRGLRLPLWNPYVGLGRPFLADPETAVLYPPNLLHPLLGPVPALYVLAVLHGILAAVGAIKLGRHLGLSPAASLVPAVCFVAGMPLVGRQQAGQVGFTQALAYLPLLLFLGARLQDTPGPRRAAALSVVLALQFLCGHPQAAWVGALGLGSFLLGRAFVPKAERPLGRHLAG